MSRFVVFVLAALTCSVTPSASQNAQILSDARYLSNDGQFGAAYTQGDGVEFKEEADAEGNRRGSYSYVDPNGKRRTVTYTAGKDGFKATGDHLPVAPTPVPVPAVPSPKSQWSQPPAVPSQWNQPWSSAPVPVARSEDGQWTADNEASKYDDGQWAKWSQSSDDSQWNEWNQWNSVPAAVPSPKQLQWNQWNSIPATAKWSSGVDAGSHWNGVAPTAPPASYSVNQASGKFNLNRSPDGFSYTYSQN